MAVIEIEKGTEWHVRRQISNTLTDHDNRIAALEGGGGGGGGKVRPIAVFDGSPDPILVGSQVRCTVTAACTITGWTIIADVSGSAVIDVRRATYAGYPTVTSIAGSAKPTLTAATKATSTTLTGWSTSLAAGDVLVFNVDSASTVEQLFIALEVA
jgi:hypothetical protein